MPERGEPAAVRQATAEIGQLSVDERSVALRVAEILRKIEFGTVLLVVQDGVVVQIEMAEKFRLR
jgi:hypothetical protein